MGACLECGWRGHSPLHARAPRHWMGPHLVAWDVLGEVGEGLHAWGLWGRRAGVATPCALHTGRPCTHAQPLGVLPLGVAPALLHPGTPLGTRACVSGRGVAPGGSWVAPGGCGTLGCTPALHLHAPRTCQTLKPRRALPPLACPCTPRPPFWRPNHVAWLVGAWGGLTRDVCGGGRVLGLRCGSQPGGLHWMGWSWAACRG